MNFEKNEKLTLKDCFGLVFGKDAPRLDLDEGVSRQNRPEAMTAMN